MDDDDSATNSLFEPEDTWPAVLDYASKGTDIQWSELFLSERPTRLLVSNGQIYSLADGIWQLTDQVALAAEIQRTNNGALDASAITRMVRTAIPMLCYTAARPFGWINPPKDAPDPVNVVPFRNGLLDTGTRRLLPYDGSFFATGRPTFDYDPAATCPRWLQALGEWFEEDSDSRVDMADTLQEFFGYAMTTDTTLHAILTLLGSGRAGKSTVVDVLQALCAPHDRVRILADLAGPHGLQGLEDARLIIIPDAADNERGQRATALGRLKAISGGDKVSINPKNQKVFETVIPGRLVLVANRHPKFLDDSGALAMRELPIVFTRSFQDDTRRDYNIGAKLAAEMSGIANWSLDGLARLRLNGAFTKGDALKAASADLSTQQSHILAFAADCLVIEKVGEASKKEMYETYEIWCWHQRIRDSEIRDRQMFKVDMLAALARHGVRLRRQRVGRKVENECWRGVTVIERPGWLHDDR